MVVFGVVVVVVVVTVATGRRAGKKYIHLPCGQLYHSEIKPFFPSFPLWWLERPILLSLWNEIITWPFFLWWALQLFLNEKKLIDPKTRFIIKFVCGHGAFGSHLNDRNVAVFSLINIVTVSNEKKMFCRRTTFVGMMVIAVRKTYLKTVNSSRKNHLTYWQSKINWYKNLLYMVMNWTHIVVGMVVGLEGQLDFGHLVNSLAECVLTEVD